MDDQDSIERLTRIETKLDGMREDAAQAREDTKKLTERVGRLERGLAYVGGAGAAVIGLGGIAWKWFNGQ